MMQEAAVRLFMRPADSSAVWRIRTSCDTCSADGISIWCTLQEESLKPFVAVLRLADSPAVRQRAVQAVAAALTAHPRGLGSGAQLPASCCRRAATQLVCSHAGRQHSRPAQPT